jgi:hypothetical protein
MNRILLILIISQCIGKLYTQSLIPDSVTHKNVLYVEYAGLVLMGNVSVNYERIISNNLWLRVGWGYGYGNLGPSELYLPRSAGTGPIVMLNLMNKGSDKIEIGIGAYYVRSLTDAAVLTLWHKQTVSHPVGTWKLCPNICLGYRYQSDDGKIFRIGASANEFGFPIYISGGRAF